MTRNRWVAVVAVALVVTAALAIVMYRSGSPDFRPGSRHSANLVEASTCTNAPGYVNAHTVTVAGRVWTARIGPMPYAWQSTPFPLHGTLVILPTSTPPVTDSTGQVDYVPAARFEMASEHIDLIDGAPFVGECSLAG
jgi:hypothetical protein